MRIGIIAPQLDDSARFGENAAMIAITDLCDGRPTAMFVSHFPPVQKKLIKYFV